MTSTLTRPTADALDDPGFVTSQMFVWAAKAWRLGFQDLCEHDHDAGKRVALAIENGVAHVEARLDLDSSTASFIVNLDNGEALELFASVPAPRMPTQ